MSFQQQVDCVVREFEGKRRELDKMIDQRDKSDDWSDSDTKQVDKLEGDLRVLREEVDRARRWLSSCGISV